MNSRLSRKPPLTGASRHCWWMPIAVLPDGLTERRDRSSMAISRIQKSTIYSTISASWWSRKAAKS